MLELLKPERVIEFGYHKGGATKWLSKYSKRVITVDVNEHVPDACKHFPNVESWQMTTGDALARISDGAMIFDLGIIDADHSRHGVRRDLEGLTEHCKIILLHDSYNLACRKGMAEGAIKKDCAYSFDFVPSTLKHDGLWGGFGVALPKEEGGIMYEYENEIPLYKYFYARSIFTISGLRSLIGEREGSLFSLALNHIRILAGQLKNRIKSLNSK